MGTFEDLNYERLFCKYIDPKDEQWISIMKSISPIGTTSPSDYKKAYLCSMDYLCNKIRSNQAFEQDGIITEELLEMLLRVSNMFYVFDLNMKQYNQYAMKNDIHLVKYEWPNQSAGIPGAHNFNAYLNYMFDEDIAFWLLDNYYIKVIDTIQEYIRKEAMELPTYVLTLEAERKGGEKHINIVKNMLIRDIGIQNDSLPLPGYYPINKKISTNPEAYKKLFYSWSTDPVRCERLYNDFLHKELPIYKWIMEHVYEES